jgi:hypothetical protein
MSYSIPVANVPQVWLLPSSCPIPVVGGCHPTVTPLFLFPSAGDWQSPALSQTSSRTFMFLKFLPNSLMFFNFPIFVPIFPYFPYSFTRFQPINLGKKPRPPRPRQRGQATAPGLQHRACWGAAAEGHSLRRVPANATAATGAWRGDGIMVGIILDILDILVGHGYCMVLLLCYRLL